MNEEQKEYLDNLKQEALDAVKKSIEISKINAP